MPRHIHTVSLDAMLSESERLLVRWLLVELNAIRTELGMPETTLEGLQALRRLEREQHALARQRGLQEGR